MEDCKYIVKYFEPVLDEGFKIEERYGQKTMVSYNNGIVNYEQQDKFNTLEECEKFIKEKSQITQDLNNKKKYINFSILENN